MIQTLGAIQQLEKNDIIERENIQSIYGTSAGAIVGVLYALHFDWDMMNDYIFQRPWREVFPIKVQTILEAYSKKGIFDHSMIEKCFKPLLQAKDLEMTITLKEFYEYSNIDLHMFTFEMNRFQVEDLSFRSHPDLLLLTAIQMTCAIPILVTPICLDNHCFIDGGVVCNYPLKYCIDAYPGEKEQMLGFKNDYEELEKNHSIITSESNLLEFMMSFLFKMIFHMTTDDQQPAILWEIICNTKCMSIEYFKNTVNYEETRRDLFQQGTEAADRFLSRFDSSSEDSCLESSVPSLQNGVQELT